jgi:uncharacterized protein
MGTWHASTQAASTAFSSTPRVLLPSASATLAELSLFGSLARGTSTSTSDVDLLYVSAPGRAPGFAINRLEDELSELFGRNVDLVSKRALHRMLRERVLAEARTLYAA